ncbi:MAG: hypothetical protein KGI70_02260 [Patescibacteria group bacterium]|nr:hypothetical protein [Patescibacteria group bacterium]
MISTGFEEIAKQFRLTVLPHSEVEWNGDVPPSALEKYRANALKHIVEHMELPGFRPGKVPPEMALKKVGEMALVEEELEHFIKDFYPALVLHHKVDVVGRPTVGVRTLAPGNPASLTIRSAVYPEVTLPKWKKLAEKIPLEEFKGELPKMEVPLTPEEEVKAREYLARNARRGKFIDALIAEAKVDVPRIFIETEQEKIIAQMKDDIARMNLKWDDYLAKLQKSESSLREEFAEQARKRAVLQLVLNKIAEEEKVVPDGAAVEAEIKHALEHFPLAGQADAKKDLLRIHVETILRNEKVLQLLENPEHT